MSRIEEMANKHNPGPDQGRVKLRYFEVEVEGGNSTLLEGIKSVAAAINRGNGAQTMKAVRAATNGNSATPLGAGATSEDDVDVDVDDDTDTIEHDVPAAPRKASAPRKQRPLKPVPGINWNDPAPSLKDFIDSLELDSTMKKYTAIAHWFKEYRDTPTITVDHIFSAYKTLGWTDFPKKSLSPLQDLKNKQEYKWFDAGANRGEYSINGYGDQEVAKWRKGSA